jgi:hypothetical protein
VKGYIDPVHFKTTNETCFRDDEELTLVEHIETMAKLGYGYSNTQLQHAAGELAFDLGKKSTNKPLSSNWLYGFLKRSRTRLSTLKPSKLDSNRARSTTHPNELISIMKILLLFLINITYTQIHKHL